jgi:hypothetical protein
MKYNMGTGDVIKPQYVVETLWNMTKDADTYITSDVSTRCGLRSITLTNHAAGSIQVAWAPWVFLTPPWASNSPNQVRGLLYYRRRLDTDVYPGAFNLPAIQHTGQDVSLNDIAAWCGGGRKWCRSLQQQLHGRLAQYVKLAGKLAMSAC